MKTRALLIMTVILAGAGLGRRALAGRETPVAPVACGAVAGWVEPEGDRLACVEEIARRCGAARAGRRYAACRDVGALRGPLLKLMDQPIDLAAADLDDLTALPGIGPGLARRIADARAQAPFCRLDDLRRVSGLGPKRLAALSGHVTFGDPLCRSASGQ